MPDGMRAMGWISSDNEHEGWAAGARSGL
jgi:hypothetical protein